MFIVLAPPGKKDMFSQLLPITLAITLLAPVVAQAQPPGPPENLAATVNGNTVTVTWQPPTSGGPFTGYQLEVWLPDLTDVGALQFPATQTSFTADNVPNGTYIAHVHTMVGTQLGPGSEPVTIVVPGGSCNSPPDAPGTLSGAANGSLVTLNWGAASGCPPTSYSLQAGTAPGLSDIAVLNVGLQTGFAANAPPGTYWVRVVAANPYGVSPPSNEISVTVGGACASPPNAPSGLTGNVSGTTVNLNWTGSAGGCAPTSYVIQAGSASGLSNIAIVDVGLQTGLSATAPAGTYFVRIVASNVNGLSAPSNEIVLTVP